MTRVVREHRWQILVASGLLVLGVSVALGQQSRSSAANKKKGGARRVVAQPLARISYSHGLELDGITRARRRAVLSFSTAGRLLWRRAEVGDSVKRGQLLARIDARAFVNQLASVKGSLGNLRAELGQAGRDARRAATLVAAKAWAARQAEAAKTRLDALSARYAAFVARRNEARRQLRESRLVAPFDGIVSSVRLELGEYATPGRPVIEVVSQQVEVGLDLPESALGTVHVGQRLSVTLPFLNRRKVGAVVRAISRAATGSGQLFPLRATLDASDVPIGVTAKVALPARTTLAFAVPLCAIVDPTGEGPSIFVADGKARRARRVDVRQLGLAGANVAIEPLERGALSAADRVIIAGLIGLADSDDVMPVRP